MPEFQFVHHKPVMECPGIEPGLPKQYLLHRVCDNFVDHLRQCTASQGRHLYDVAHHK